LLGGIQLFQGDDRVFGEVLLAGAGLCLLWIIAGAIRKKPG
jgi:hypothetical protein